MECIENTPPLYILLPTCFESKSDVFFNIIRNTIARSKLDAHYLDNALKCGMSGERFSIELEDITVCWTELDSIEQQIRQSKILGYWAVENFPSLRKKLFGASWKLPERQSFQIVGQSKIINADEVDEIVFKKLKLRLLELSVSTSTSNKLKYFAVQPTNIGKNSPQSLSPKIKSFDIDSECIEDCWKKLKLGSQSASEAKRQINRDKEDASSNSGKPSIGSKSVSAKRTHLDIDRTDSNSNGTGDASTGSKSVPPAKKINLDIDQTDSNSNGTGDASTGSKSVPPAKKINLVIDRTNCNSNGTDDANTSTIQAALLDIKKGVENLTGFIETDR